MSTRWRTGSWQSKHTPPPSNLPIRASSYALPCWLGIIALHFHCILAIGTTLHLQEILAYSQCSYRHRTMDQKAWRGGKTLSQYLPSGPSTGPPAASVSNSRRRFATRLQRGISKPGQRLPSTRALSVSLGIARGTIVEAFDQLYAEGYLATRARSGTIVANVHEGASEVTSQDVTVDIAAPDLPLPENVGRLAAVGKALRPQGSLPFAIAHPAGAVAPDDKWRRLGNRVRATRPAAPSGYIDPRGLPELRLAIADYVRKARAV